MALISCPECDENISNAASACPHCGFPIVSTSNDYSSASTSTATMSDNTVRDELRNYRKLTRIEMTCLECGYKGFLVFQIRMYIPEVLLSHLFYQLSYS